MKLHMGKFIDGSSGDSFVKRGIEFFWFNGKLAQKSSEKVLKDAMKPSQNSSAYVYESWRQTESNRFFTRLLNGTVYLYAYV
ncbi:hypothetical protein F2Q69_00058540 [Brassica cretica]|uniref:Uncharacterized protein n=1 Tax=Brassica cretica TaxID=69181 RepID=A0A8S9RRN7_BRACR|nr:hypothetical protein F2Q69_00058540 [Brassica cretica]